MSSATIGALRAVFGADTAAFEKGVDRVSRELKKTERQFKRMGERTTKIGKALSLGFTAPLLLIGTSSVKAGADHAEAMAQVEAGLQSMGDASGKTSEQLKKSALELEGLSNFNADDVLRKVTANMLTFGNVSGDTFDRAQQAAVDLSERLDQDLKTSTIAVGKALNDPVLGLTALSRVGIQFTDDQKKLVKGMVELGDTAGAQNIILEELERQYAGSAKAAQDAVPGSDLQDAYARFSRVVGELALKVLPPLSAALSAVLDSFNNLSPGMQRNIVIAGALLAALGPVIAVIGTLITVLAPLSAAITVAAGATATLGTALTVALGPIGLVVAGIGLLTGAYILNKNKTDELRMAKDELYSLIEQSEGLRNREKASSKAQAKANLEEAISIRERIQARLEEQQALLKSQLQQREDIQNNSGGHARRNGLKRNARDVEETTAAIAAMEAELNKNLEDIDLLSATYEDFADVQKTVIKTSSELKKEQADAAKKAKDMAAAAKKLADSHDKIVESHKEEIETNQLLGEALKVSQREYEITAEYLDIMRDGFQGSKEEARAMAEELIASREGFREIEEASLAAEEALKKSTEASKDKKKSQDDNLTCQEKITKSINEEVAENEKLAAALKVSQHEYNVTAEVIKIMKDGFEGPGEEARIMAEKLVASRDKLSGIQDAARKTADELKKAGDTGVNAFTGILGSFNDLLGSLGSGDFGSLISGIGGALGGLFGDDGGGGGGIGGLLGAAGGIIDLFKGSGSSSSDGTVNGFYKPEYTVPGSSLSPAHAAAISADASSMPDKAAISIQLEASPLFDTKIDRRAAAIAAPIAEVTTVKGVSQYNQTTGNKSRQKLTRR